MSEDRSVPSDLVSDETLNLADPPGAFLNPMALDKYASVLVAGLGRSGTTMASRVLSILGLFMGDLLSAHTNEDADFRRAIKRLRNPQQRSLSDFELLCQDRDGRFDRWGFKYPQAWNYLPELVAVMRSPRVIITSRDPLAIAMRRASVLGTQVLPTMAQSLSSMLSLHDTVQKLECPILLLSYEKSLTRPHDCVSMLASFCGIDAGPSTLKAAADIVRNGHSAYFGRQVDRNDTNCG